MSGRLRPLLILLALAITMALIAIPLQRWVGRIVERVEGRGPEPAADTTPGGVRGPVGEALPPLAVEGWLNGGPLTADSLAGHPVIVALWSNTDPGSLRGLARLQAWQDAYARYGVRVVGVHQPVFAFAADPRNVESTARRYRLTFPIALDASLQLWTGLASREPRFWLILADRNGRIVRAGPGERSVPAIEQEVRRELRASRPWTPFPKADPTAAGALPIRAAGEAGTASPHPPVFLGVARVPSGPLAAAAPGRPERFVAEFRFQVEGSAYTPYPVGLWSATAEGATAARGGAENFIALRYDAGPLGAVLSPPPEGATRVWVLRDDRWLTADELGADARLDGRGGSYVEVDEPRFYDVCRATGGTHVIKLAPEVAGVTVHAIAFESSTPDGPARP